MLDVLGQEIQNALIISLIAALLNIIPYVGPFISGILIILLTMTSNIEISFDGEDMAKSVSYVQAWHRKPSGPEDDYEVRGQYHDNWVRTDEGWRISYRKFLTMAATPPRPDAPGIGRIA